MSKSDKKKAQEVYDTVKRYEVGGQMMSEIPINLIDPNPWNPNRMNEETFAKEKASITEYGMVAPVLLRYKGAGRWEIIDGEHRFKACKELGFKAILAVDLGELSDQKAKKLTIIANDLRGKSDPNDLAKLVADLAAQENPEELARLLPQSQVEIESMISSLQPYDLTAFTGSGGDVSGQPSADPTEVPSLAGMGKDIRIQLGPVKGTVPETLFRKLLEEFTNSAQHVGSKNVELVVQDLVQRLQGTRHAPKAAEPAPKAESTSQAGFCSSTGRF